MYGKIAGIYSKAIDIDKRKYDLFFSFHNVFAVFRTGNHGTYSEDSRNSEMIYYDYTTANNPNAVLTDLIFLAKIGRLTLKINDIVVVRFNGQLQSYRFHGVIQNAISDKDCFVKLDDFTEAERVGYIEKIHSENCVLSVLDGKLLHLSNINLKKTIPCAIDGKIFQTAKESFMSDYSLYVYENDKVHIIDPDQRPFLQINVALLFFNQLKSKKKPLLLLNRKELELVRDYFQLRKLAFV